MDELEKQKQILQEKKKVKELNKAKRVLEMGAMSPISKTPRKENKDVTISTPTHLKVQQVFGSPKMALLGKSGKEIELSELGTINSGVCSTPQDLSKSCLLYTSPSPRDS